MNTVHINIQQYPNVFSKQQCRELIAICKSELLSYLETGIQFENSQAQEVFLRKDLDYEVLKNVRKLVADKSGMPIENQELISFMRYEVGGGFKPHHDYFESHRPLYNGLLNQGGQRVKTCLVYLNEEFEGGETEFGIIGEKIKPQTGKMVVWNNTDNAGNVIPESEHEGLKVTSGVKYLLSIWIRQEEYRNDISLI